MRLYYDNVSRTTSNSPGVEIRVPGFGDTLTVEWLDPSKASPGAYFNKIADSLALLGLERNFTIRGIPYDFRKAPNENIDLFSNLKNIIEETADRTGKPVVIVAHSMGAPNSLYFLNKQTSGWKKKYIKSLVTLAGCWGGTVKALKVFAQGDNLGVSVLSEATLREEQRSNPSLAWLMPSKHFWAIDEPLVKTANKSYGVGSYEEFFKDINYPDGYDMWLDTKDLIPDLSPPDVEVHCLYGTGIETVESLFYSKDLPFGKAKLLTTLDGDGTVNLRSLEGCKRWIGKQRDPVYTRELMGRDHMAVLADPVVLAYINALVTGIDPNTVIGLETNEIN
ncbi:hypothetical protein QYM36_001365 [Artemia franciscana]|nr:hypothetical protein QYM36_001365 [Artemia franciscana]